MVEIVEGELNIVFTIGCCPLKSYFTPKFEFKVPTPETSEGMIELTLLVRGFDIFPSDFFLLFFVSLVT